MTTPNDDKANKANPNSKNIGDEIQKSFRNLRRMMGMEPDEEIIETEGGNMEVSFATARPSVTFTSLRKLVDERASFCMPSTSKKPKPSVAKMSRGVYDDSDREEDGGDDLFFAEDDALTSSPSLFQGVSTPPISPILKTPDSDAKVVSRSILPELEAQATSKNEHIKVETVDSEDDDEDDSQVEEQAPPATPTPRRLDKQTKSRGSFWTVLYVFVGFLVLALGGFVGRLYQLNKLDHFVTQVKDGGMDSKHFKVIMVEVTGTQDVDFYQHYADMERNVKATFKSSRQKLQENVDNLQSQFDILQHQIVENAKFYQDKMGDAWEQLTVENVVGEENVALFHQKRADVEVLLAQLRSDAAKHYDQSRTTMQLKFEKIMESETIASMKEKLADLQAALITFYDDNGFRAYLQSTGVIEQEGAVTDTCASAPAVEENSVIADIDDFDVDGENDVASDDEQHAMMDTCQVDVSDEEEVAEENMEETQAEESSTIDGDLTNMEENLSPMEEISDDIMAETPVYQPDDVMDDSSESNRKTFEEAEVVDDQVTDEPSIVESDLIETTQGDPDSSDKEEFIASSDKEEVIVMVETESETDMDAERIEHQDEGVFNEEESPASTEEGNFDETKIEPQEEVDTDATKAETESVILECVTTEEIDILEEQIKIEAAISKQKPLRKVRNALGSIFGKMSDEDFQSDQELHKLKAELDGMLQNIPKSKTVVTDEEIVELMKKEDLICEDPKAMQKIKASFGKVFRRNKMVAVAESD